MGTSSYMLPLKSLGLVQFFFMFSKEAFYVHQENSQFVKL